MKAVRRRRWHLRCGKKVLKFVRPVPMVTDRGRAKALEASLSNMPLVEPSLVEQSNGEGWGLLIKSGGDIAKRLTIPLCHGYLFYIVFNIFITLV